MPTAPAPPAPPPATAAEAGTPPQPPVLYMLSPAGTCGAEPSRTVVPQPPSGTAGAPACQLLRRISASGASHAGQSSHACTGCTGVRNAAMAAPRSAPDAAPAPVCMGVDAPRRRGSGLAYCACFGSGAAADQSAPGAPQSSALLIAAGCTSDTPSGVREPAAGTPRRRPPGPRGGGNSSAGAWRSCTLLSAACAANHGDVCGSALLGRRCCGPAGLRVRDGGRRSDGGSGGSGIAGGAGGNASHSPRPPHAACCACWPPSTTASARLSAADLTGTPSTLAVSRAPSTCRAPGVAGCS